MSDLIPTGVSRLSEGDIYGKFRCTYCFRNGSKIWCADCAISGVGDIRVFYCSERCQRAHVLEHKHTCFARKRFGRAVHTLHRVWTAYHKATNYKRYRITHEKNHKIYVTDFKPSDEDLLTGASTFTTAYENAPSGSQAHVSEEAQLALRALNECWQPASVAASFVLFFLKDVGQVSQIACNIKNAAKALYYGSKQLSGSGHSIIRAALPGQDLFAVDLTGWQYGWEQVLTPWPVYQRHRIECFLSMSTIKIPWIMNGDWDSQFAARAFLRDRVAMEAARAGEAYLRTQGATTMRQFLDLSTEKYEKLSDTMVKKITEKIDHEMTMIYTEGLGRWYFNGHEKVIALSRDRAEKCQNLWMTQELLSQAIADGEETSWLLEAWRDELMGEEPEGKTVRGINFGSGWY